MTASDKIGGYQCEFIGEILEDLKCRVCKHVARNSSFITCCGEHFCQECVKPLLDYRKPCPACSEAEFSVIIDKKYNTKILALEVHCSMKDRGCEWTGKLEGLEAHLDVNTGDCEYVDVECPNGCDQLVGKHNLPTHLANSCPKREFVCQYCNFRATYEVVSNDHWPQCPFYPVPCPNACGIQAIERGDIEAHLLQCTLEEVECAFGCNTKLSHQEMERHMEENTQKHLIMMSARIGQKFEQKIKTIEDQISQKDEEIQLLLAKEKQLKAHTQENEAEIRDLKQQLQQQKQQIDTLERYIGILIKMPNFGEYKERQEYWCSRPIYTHPCGYKFCFRVNAYGIGTHMSVCLEPLKGEFDRQLMWPALCIVTLELLNQRKNMCHLIMTRTFQWHKPTPKKTFEEAGFTPIAHEELTYDAERQTQYLADNCLLFRLSNVEVLPQKEVSPQE